MSTKAIRLVLKAAAQAAHENNEMTPDVAEVLHAAEKEVEAIERACSGIAAGYIKCRALEEEWANEAALLETIGEQAP